MHGRRIFTISAIVLAAATLLAAQPDYFPLIAGNQWVYRGPGGPLQLEITRIGEFEGRTYHLLEGLPEGDRWLRRDDAGSVLAWDPERGEESLWWGFGRPEGEPYQRGAAGQAVVRSRAAEYRGPVGAFETALRIEYPDASRAELFLPYIGLVHRSQADASYDLSYARVGGVTVVSEPELTVSLTLDQSVYTANLMPPVDPAHAVPLMTARLTLRNTTPEPVELVFPTGQSYDLVIRNEQGEELLRWSEGRFFTQAIRRETVEKGEKNFVIELLLGREGTPLPEGRYTAEAWLTTMGPLRYAATAGFEIRHVH